MNKEFYKFESHLRKVGILETNNLTDRDLIIKNEPMFFRSSFDFCRLNGHYLTQKFLDFLETRYDHIPKDHFFIDSRSHMLMPGFYPAIPGWHHDDVARTTPSGQPNYDKYDYYSQHIMCVIGDSAMTEFYLGDTNMPKVDINNGEKIYDKWNKYINDVYLTDPTKKHLVHKVESNNIYHFTCEDFHRATPSEKSCWRWFIRATYNKKGIHKNEIRNQVNVYPSQLEGGW